MDKIFSGKEKLPYKALFDRITAGNLSFEYDWEPKTEQDFNILKDIVQNESVVHLSDLILRRTSLGDNPERALRILPKLRSIFDMDDLQWQEEVDRVKTELKLK